MANMLIQLCVRMEDKMEGELARRWADLNQRLSKEIEDKWWQAICLKYKEQHRKYHNLAHIHRMVGLLDQYSQSLAHPRSVGYAIFFHDLTYDPQSDENEERSADSFRIFAAEAKLCEELTSQVVDLILETKTHSTEEHKDSHLFGTEDRHFFLDFDMEILGVAPETPPTCLMKQVSPTYLCVWENKWLAVVVYETYAAQIREEYSFLPEDIYVSLRTKVLQSFLQIPNIFATREFRESHEQQARDNISWEIRKLQEGK
ncbi:hypothetical protein LAZ67_14000418 [Cordylochernes scorpioides]|uniref:Uncharacterized protein n=1 Tax=Cordylochernes scorpioides TaxID=51811 RepID=A0ABY6L5L1_9ARAC|nr:hypothetical protein LAZ67_14000418 [Cordylochernes scorpioides]